MFLPFKNLSARQSAGYAVLCVALGLGIKYMDDNMPQKDPSKAKGDGLVCTPVSIDPVHMRGWISTAKQ
ncbi:hypothetical protein V7S43_011174 [Phytophthora oleae]|uniref:Uncharacterized protein n=1 Tax=Phytophthora oleae TaxID=2107226 RepID=A0ABD3FE38_9STRA